MSPSVSLLVILSCIFRTMRATINSTTSNATGSFWITSDYYNSGEYFKNDLITCSASYCHIVCDVDLGCIELNVRATSSLTTLVIQCQQYLSCARAVIYANTTNAVKVSCGRYSCQNLKLYAENVQNGVNIACAGQSACWAAYVDASNIGNSLIVACSGASSCRKANIYCPSDSPCDIHCTGDWSCMVTNLYIPSRWKNPLNLEYLCSKASSGACQEANIVCEDTHLTAPLVFADDEWGCSDDGCCPYASIETVPCFPGVSCQIDCDIQTCYGRYINATEATSLAMDCGTNGCQDAKIQCPASTDASCNIRCPTPYSCQYVSVHTGSNTMNQLGLYCDGSYGCQYMQLQVDAAKIETFDLNCSASNSCNGLDTSSVTSSIINYLYIDCTADKACYQTNISGTIASNARIDCVNPTVCTSHTSGACYFASFHIYGDQTNNVSFLCGAYDCYEATLNVTGVLGVDIRCSNPYACWESAIYASKSGQLSVECSGESGCQFASIGCPSVGSCDVDCLGFDACILEWRWLL
eukprot:908708_1